MNIKQLEYFVSAAETLNFTKTGEQFFISQTAISLQMKALEDELGTQLFERKNHRVTITYAGRMFLEDAKAILNRMQSAKLRLQEISAGDLGKLGIGFVRNAEQTHLSNLIQDFKNRYPGVDLSFYSGNVSDLDHAILKREIDVAFNLSFGLNFPEEIAYHQLQKCNLFVAMHQDNPLAIHKELCRMQLQNEPMIIFQAYEDEQEETRKIAQDYKDTGFLPNVVQTSNDINTILLLVAVKKGIAVLPEYAPQRGADIRNITFIPLTGEKEQRNLYLIWRKDNQNKTLHNFLNYMEIQ